MPNLEQESSLKKEHHPIRTLILMGLGLRKRVRVSGHSMNPVLEDGDEVLVDTQIYKKSRPKPGDIILAGHPYKRSTQIIKQVHHINSEGRIYLLGLNADLSTDSRSFGAIHPDQVQGRVVSLV